jgi:hypothetical protein
MALSSKSLIMRRQTLPAGRLRGMTGRGSGVLFEVRTALGLAQGVLAERLYLARENISRLEAAGALPAGREPRYILLSLARHIPRSQRSLELDSWMKAARHEFAKAPLGGGFLCELPRTSKKAS